MENKKSYLVIIIILALYVAIVLLLKKNNVFEPKNNYIIFSDEQILEINKDKYSFVEKIDNLQNLNFKVYDYTTYLGDYQVNYIDGKYRVFGEDNSAIKFNNDFLAIYSTDDSIKLNTSNTELLNENDNYIIDKILKQENINSSIDNIQGYKRIINIKGEKKYLYNITNTDNNQLFSILFIWNENDSLLIDKSIVSKENYINLKSFYVNAIIDIDNDGTDEIILNTLSYSQMGGKTKSILRYDKQKYKNIEIEKSK